MKITFIFLLTIALCNGSKSKLQNAEMTENRLENAYEGKHFKPIRPTRPNRPTQSTTSSTEASSTSTEDSESSSQAMKDALTNDKGKHFPLPAWIPSVPGMPSMPDMPTMLLDDPSQTPVRQFKKGANKNFNLPTMPALPIG